MGRTDWLISVPAPTYLGLDVRLLNVCLFTCITPVAWAKQLQIGQRNKGDLISIALPMQVTCNKEICTKMVE